MSAQAAPRRLRKKRHPAGTGLNEIYFFGHKANSPINRCLFRLSLLCRAVGQARGPGDCRVAGSEREDLVPPGLQLQEEMAQTGLTQETARDSWLTH